MEDRSKQLVRNSAGIGSKFIAAAPLNYKYKRWVASIAMVLGAWEFKSQITDNKLVFSTHPEVKPSPDRGKSSSISGVGITNWDSQKGELRRRWSRDWLHLNVVHQQPRVLTLYRVDIDSCCNLRTTVSSSLQTTELVLIKHSSSCLWWPHKEDQPHKGESTFSFYPPAIWGWDPLWEPSPHWLQYLCVQACWWWRNQISGVKCSMGGNLGHPRRCVSECLWYWIILGH